MKRVNINGILWRLLLIIIFIVLAFFVIGYASGYGLDIKSKTVYRTGIIEVQPQPKECDIYLNDEKVSSGEYRGNLLPGNYDIKITKNGYFDYNDSVYLSKGQAIILNQVQLFLKDPKIEKFSENSFKNELSKVAETDGLMTTRGEIYQNDNFVTRYSSDLYSPSWFPNRRLISFTKDNRLHLLSIESNYDVDILEKDSKTPAVFVNSGRTVIYENKGELYSAKIIGDEGKSGNIQSQN